MDAEQTLKAVRELVGAPAPVVQPTNMDELLEQAKSLPADFKIKLLEAMGFSPVGSDHTDDCPHNFDSGLICQCVPPATMWSQPSDVDEARGETWEQRRECAVSGPSRIIPAAERW
jgi:hypothetical protein